MLFSLAIVEKNEEEIGKVFLIEKQWFCRFANLQQLIADSIGSLSLVSNQNHTLQFISKLICNGKIII